MIMHDTSVSADISKITNDKIGLQFNTKAGHVNEECASIETPLTLPISRQAV